MKRGITRRYTQQKSKTVLIDRKIGNRSKKRLFHVCSSLYASVRTHVRSTGHTQKRIENKSRFFFFLSLDLRTNQINSRQKNGNIRILIALFKKKLTLLGNREWIVITPEMQLLVDRLFFFFIITPSHTYLVPFLSSL